jgi:hypothetical protein
VLQPEEVTSTAYVCNGSQATPCTTLEGSVTIENSLDWKALVDSGCTAITGNLSISAPGLVGPLNAPALRSVGGNLRIFSNTTLTNFSLPVLTTVGDLIISGNTALTNFNLSALTNVTGGLNVPANTALTSLSLPALTTVTGYLFVQSNTALTSFSLPALTSVGGGLGVTNNAALTSFSLAALTTVLDLNVIGNAALTSFSLPVLATLSGFLDVRGNTALPECLALAFKDHLVAAHGFTGAWSIFGNDTTATCPP